MDRVTTGLEALGVLMIVAAVVWQVAVLVSGPVGLVAGALLAWLSSWLLQGAPIPRHRKGAKR